MQQTQQALSRQNGTKRMRVRRRALSPAVMTVFSLVGAALVVASNSAVTPLYRLYQQSMHLTPLMITLVYAVYFPIESERRGDRRYLDWFVMRHNHRRSSG